MDQESVEIPNSCGARRSKHVKSGDMMCFGQDDVTTLWEGMERSIGLFAKEKCMGQKLSDDGYTWITYKEMFERIENFGSGLSALGIESGQSTLVGFYARNCAEWVIGAYACYRHSCIVVPIYDTLGPAASTFIVNHAKTQAIICDDRKVLDLLAKKKELPCLKHIVVIGKLTKELRELAQDGNISLHSFTDIEEMGRNSPSAKLPPKMADICLIIYTSGTTGDPKGVVLTHKYMISSTDGMLTQMGDVAFRKTDVMLSYLPLGHIYEHLVETIMIRVGGSFGFFQGNVAYLTDDMVELQPTYLPMVPRVLNRLYNKAQALLHASNELDSLIPEKAEISDAKWSEACQTFLKMLGGKLRIISTGAAPSSVAMMEFFHLDLGLDVIELYGLTECAPCTLNVVRKDCMGNVGPPLPCSIIKLIDVPDMGYLTKNKQGEVCLKGHNMFNGYFKDPVRTRSAFDEDEWFLTGDIGMWHPNGTLKIVDRRKHIFKLAQGVYLSPEKIENIYMSSPYVSQIILYGDCLKSYLVAIVVPNKEVVLPWCTEHLQIKNWEEACSTTEMKLMILEDMRRVGKDAGLLSFEQVRKITLHPDALTHESGVLTPTLKTKRDACRLHFAKEIETMYSDE